MYVIRQRQTNLSIEQEGMQNPFEDITAGIFTIRPMPDELKRYDQVISGSEARAEAADVFLRWVHRRIVGTTYQLWTAEADLPCSEIASDFFPDFPVPSDFESGTFDFEYRRQEAEAAMTMADAKRRCWEECSLRRLCLARAMQADAEYEAGPEFYAVQGGWGPGALIKISNYFGLLRRSYERGVSESVQLSSARESGVSTHEIAMLSASFTGMSEGDREQREREALLLSS